MTLDYKYAQVIVDIPALELNMRTFSYLIPDELKEKALVGSPVTIPFGRQDPLFGYIVGFTNYVPENIKVKPIFEILDDESLFDLDYLKFIEWVANYYMCPLVSAISTAIPSGLWSNTKRTAGFTEIFSEDILYTLSPVEQKVCQTLQQSKKNAFSPSTIAFKTKFTRQKVYSILRSLKEKGLVKLETVTEGVKPKLVDYVTLLSTETDNKRQAEVLKVLSEEPNQTCELKELVNKAKTTHATIKKLADQGLLKRFQKEQFRNPLERFAGIDKDVNLPLTVYQQKALDDIVHFIDEEDDPGPMLVHGVTGSGKTEVYFRAMQEVMSQGKSVIFLVPEITLTSQISARVISRFGPDTVGIWHSALSAGEKLDMWKRIHSGEIKIVLGARSGVFAPVKNLGLIIIDEEHESSYKQDTPAPRYHTKDVALERARRFGAKVLLGSATPDVSTYYKAYNAGKIVSLPYRVKEQAMPSVSVINMKQELENGNKSMFSRKLKYEIQECLERKQQTMLLMNRRGFTTYVFCRDCGYTATCKSCAIPLIYHNTSGNLRCHYCNHQRANYTECPECSSPRIKHFGAGTQKVESEIQRVFPDARVLRLDSDVTTKKNAHYEIIGQFQRGEADILIGTQMIAKGLDIPKVTLVGVIAADSSFTFPDYRAMERGFQLLTQVAGRAGRGDDPGKVIFQTYAESVYALSCAKMQDYSTFYSLEMYERERYHYPPFAQLVRIIISSDDYTIAFSDALGLSSHLTEAFKDVEEKLEVLGPADCIIPKIQDKYRMQIILKNMMSIKGHELVSSAMSTFQPQGAKVMVDVDPMNML